MHGRRRSALEMVTRGAVDWSAACATTLIIFAGLLIYGANDAVLTPLFAAVINVGVAVALILAPSRGLGSLARSERVMSFAALGFMAWALLGLVSVAPPLRHPLWAAFGLGGGAVSIAPYRAIEGVAQFLCPVGAYALGAMTAYQRVARDRLGASLAALTAVYGAFALIQLFVQPGVYYGRLNAGLGSANAAALVFIILSCILIVQLVRKARRFDGHGIAALFAPLIAAPLSVVALCLALAAIILTGSRGGAVAGIAALVALVAMLVWLKRSKTYKGRSLAWVAALMVALSASGAGIMLARLNTLEADAIVRSVLRDTHWRAFLDRPWWGHGINTYHEINVHYADPQTFQILSAAGAAHNIYVQALEEGGVVGAGLLALCLAIPFVRAAGMVIRRGSGAEWAAATLAAEIAILLHGMIDFGLQVPAIAALFAFLAGAFARAPADRYVNP